MSMVYDIHTLITGSGVRWGTGNGPLHLNYRYVEVYTENQEFQEPPGFRIRDQISLFVYVSRPRTLA
jgi:hypothetical protein